MFYDRYVALCQKHGVSPSRAALDAGLSKSTVTKWKNDPNALPTGNVIDKLIRYFGVSVSDLLGEKETPPDPVRQEFMRLLDSMTAEQRNGLFAFMLRLRRAREK